MCGSVRRTDDLIRLAASAAGMSVSTFVVSRARAAAEEVLGDRAHPFLDAEAWDCHGLQGRLSESPTYKPGLARLLAGRARHAALDGLGDPADAVDAGLQGQSGAWSDPPAAAPQPGRPPGSGGGGMFE